MSFANVAAFDPTRSLVDVSPRPGKQTCRPNGAVGIHKSRFSDFQEGMAVMGA
jgi:hypothetical protein